MTIDDLKFKKPKSCAHCLAWMDNYCRLGYKLEIIEPPVIWNRPRLWDSWVVKTKPAELCPKPKNNKELMVVFNHYQMDWNALSLRNT